MADFIKHTATLPGGPISYIKGGTGRPLLYIHGTGGPNMTPVIARYTEHRTVYLPTMPGWEATPAHPSVKSMKDLGDVCADFIQNVIGEKCDVIGTSFGGWIAQWLAARHGELVDNLVLQVTAGMRDPGTGGLPTDPAELRRQTYRYPERAPAPTRTQEVYWANRKIRDVVAGGLAHDTELEALLPQIKARSLIVFGLNDEISPHDKAAPRLKRGIPHAHMAFVHDAAHAIESDQPERIFRLVTAFFERGANFTVGSDGVVPAV